MTRMSPVVVFWPWSSDRAVEATLQRIRESAPPDTVVTVADPESGFAKAINNAARSSRGTDLVIVADACEPADDWLGRLGAAACADDTVAAATALPAGAGESLFPGFDGDPVVGAEPMNGTREAPRHAVHPRIFRLWPNCTYIRSPGFGATRPVR